MTISGAELRLLAVQRIRYGEQLQRRHELDGVGCCQRCGRVYPCEGHRLGTALIEYYRQFAANDQAAANPAERPDGHRTHHAPR